MHVGKHIPTKQLLSVAAYLNNLKMLQVTVRENPLLEKMLLIQQHLILKPTFS